MSFIYFIILIGVLIFVHELGHFLFAKLFGVKVLRFSIGMGPKMVGFTRGETEYVICWLPLGGYVRMLGFELDEVEELSEEDRGRSLMMQPIWQRAIITLAGPVFNLILPLIIYFIAGMMQTTAPPSVVGEVFAETPAAEAGLQAGDQITRLDDTPITYWHELNQFMGDAYDREVALTYTRDGESQTVSVRPEKKTSTDFMGLHVRTYGMLGIHQQPYGATIGLRNPDSPAAKAGLQTFDRVININGESITRYDEIESIVRQSEGKPLKMLVMHRRAIDTDYARFYAQQPAEIEVRAEKIDGVYSLNLDSAEMYLSKVDADSPAALAGLRTGDKVLAIDGRVYSNFAQLSRQIINEVNEGVVAQKAEGVDEPKIELEYKLTYERDEQVHETTFAPIVRKYKGHGDQPVYRVVFGWGHLSERVEPDEIDFPALTRAGFAASQAIEETTNFSKMIVMGFVRMAQGRVGMDNLGGPIMIGELAAEAGKAGWGPFLQMMALISINLGVINLLPIPMLDGGHLLLYALEAIKRGPLSYRTRQVAAYVGISIIVFLMVFAFKNDIERNWDSIAAWINNL
ncbi:RIP metalloprotease RseP [Bradymonas sediminis]|uniref:RIP metalloprotease RseP n=1 Tax=Bradymonas sediminis TaxID=1548548 RepID=A0A2Z4FMV5_9DELT|nr:RIP metalloprotease RseP [Bradymonas sediminis]AWV90299.1 RIP metalloprotease RseP [Bradymonas sediminis]TDP75729.1 regulator of sigma E protease [Bradymonas sediminis]